MNGNEQGLAGQCLSLARLLDFLAHYFLDGPAEENDRVLTDMEWVGGLRDAGLVENIASRCPVTTLEMHRNQFEASFRIPGSKAIPPYEQSYMEKKPASSGETPAVACRRIFDAAGYALAPYEDVQPDHLGHQLRFVSELFKKEADCLEHGDMQGGGNVATWRTGFMTDHCQWWPDLACAVKKGTQCRQMEIVADLLISLPPILSRADLASST